ncbi:hypothetical protein LQ318_16380 [Aliifodinibius salicampi]|uniref:Uncharacterized protein n=1 Tax=Fodinibius salicampi TaxID=1920655 RepID=A0ABT3Q306_9BACT|nr:hypothetical protein [Fodinibius salicampi]MCW9714484.1 hypothetical protein [Fodinibius salicampi]
MSRKLLYSLIGFGVLILAIIGYHFYAANQAEQQIEMLIEQQTDTANAPVVEYSSLKVTPFSGKVIMRDLTIVMNQHIERADKLTIDLSYIDALKFYTGGTEYALENIYSGKANLINPSYLNQSKQHRVSAEQLQLFFEGQALDAIRTAVLDTAYSVSQHFRAEGTKLQMEFPNTLVSGLKANTFQYQGSIESNNVDYWRQGVHEVTMDSLTWTPLASFQENYNFFIKGFGYAPDAIPFKSASFTSKPDSASNRLYIHSELKAELAQVTAKGYLDPQQSLAQSQLEEASITIDNFSDSFERVLQNAQKLFSFSLNQRNGAIVFDIRGTMDDPNVSKKANSLPGDSTGN